MDEKIRSVNYLIDVNKLSAYETIYIYGMGEVLSSVAEILNFLKTKNQWKNNVIIFHSEEVNSIKHSFFSSIKKSCLIIANNEGKVSKEMIYLAKLGFETIIDGYQLIHYFYQPLKFFIRNDILNKERVPDESYREHWEQATALNKIILLNYIGRSGSYYFMTLLEHHPKLIVMPFKALYNPKTTLVALKYCHPDEINIDELVSAFKINKDISYNQHMLKFRVGENNQLYPEGYEEIYIDTLKKLILEEAYVKGGVIDEAFLIKAQYFSHMLAIGMDMNFDSGIPYIVEQIHTIDIRIIKKYRELFSKCIQIATVRNIVSSFGSLLSGMERMKMLSPLTVYSILDALIKNPSISSPEIAKDSILIRIEDLNSRPEEVLKLLCNYLKIPWDGILLKNTLNGQIFYDSYDFDREEGYKTGPRQDGIVKTYQEFLSTFDKFRLEALFYWIMKEFGYDVHEYREKEVIIELFKFPFRFEDRMEFRTVEEQCKFHKKLENMCEKYFIELCSEKKPEYLSLIKIIN